MGSVSHQKLPRSAKAGHLVTKVTAVDADSGHNAWISYKVVEATDASLLGVNLYTGEVRTKRAVSEQDDASQMLLIEIKDNGEPVQSTTVTVGILLEDGVHEPVSDLRQKAQEPSQKNSKITFYLIVSLASVSAVSFVTFVILTVKCVRNSRRGACCCVRQSDSDGYKNPNRNLQIQLNTDGPIKYVEVLGGDMLSQSQSFRSCLSPVSEFSDFTFVKPSSTTDFKEMINVLDASLPDSAWTFESQQLHRVEVEIQDINDNAPSFITKEHILKVAEHVAPGARFPLESAHDPDVDLGENAKISYSILDSKVQDVSVSSYIYINSDNGSIFSMHSFDYEKLKVFQIQVQAKDQGSPSLSSNTTVHVFILDQNDNAPAVIYPSVIMGSVSHQKLPRSAKAGHLVTKVTAVDADSGHNAWISYKVVEATDASLLGVNLYTGEVRTKRAVSEQDDASQMLLIEIKDNGEPVQSTTVTVGILLEDGVHEPVSDLRQKAQEPSQKNSKITFYLIISLASVSAVSFVTFVILTVKCVRNSRRGACCCVRQSDSDGYKNPNRNLQIQLNTDGPIKYVEVLGGDMLSQSQSFRSCLSPVSEFSDFTFVKPSSTTDFKEMINVLDASLPDSAWTFESQQIMLQNPLEVHRVLVDVVDVNDNSPKFPNANISLEISEAAAPGTRFRLESAQDPDVGINSLRTYLLGPNDCFVLNVETKSDGSKFPELILEKALDRETQAAFSLLLTAVDGGQPEKSGTALVLITILDVNDNAPVFDQAVQKVSLLENSPPGTLVTKLNATDLDYGLNGEVSFMFSKYTPERVLQLFSVDSKTGEIRVNGLPFKLNSQFGESVLVTEGPLDRETVPQYTILITAKDSGSPPLSSQESFTVTVTDVNDNAPVFSQPSYSVDVAENNGPSTPIVTVSASDPDVGSNAHVSFSILPSSVGGMSVSSYVYINPENGNIYSMRSLDYEQLNAFRIEVQARDAGSPPQTSNVTVHVFVVDENDNAPALVYPALPDDGALQLSVPRSASLGHLLSKIVCVDPDSGHNAWLSYSIAPQQDALQFRIAPRTGELRTAQRFAEEEAGSVHSIVVVVQDNGTPSLSTTVTVSITVEERDSDSTSDLHKASARGHGLTDVTLYLIISLACVSAISFLTFALLLVRCLRHRDPLGGCGDSCCCYSRPNLRTRHAQHQRAQKNLHLQLNTDGPIKYMEVVGGPTDHHGQTYRPCYSTLSNRSDFVFIKTLSPPTPMMSNSNTLSMTLSRKHLLTTIDEQKPPNTDWRFSQNQRPGTSGPNKYNTTQIRWTPYGRPRAAPPPEAAQLQAGTGPWPNPPTEAEQLQALMAAANEVSEATATLGPGTMGLSTRYSPQFTLQHVPDYRQNVYIPGSTATLTANQQQPQQPQPPQPALPQPPPQAEAPKAQTPASKKKSAKKDKK
ncbi:hypothetical protein AAFF_G00322520 [Aldrovandia affinis]|uniref:Cadherin domain-containing protein n=1 Tax=Aldrovandia affinis TaxID=143900 RepID=A0AAD7SPA4_9TELE|nr:hypothetical protein AAFF_G00322520 [Aldrovandia affinis]